MPTGYITKKVCQLFYYALALLFLPSPGCAEPITDYSLLVGKPPFGDSPPMKLVEVQALEPVCKLILTNWTNGNQFWLSGSNEKLFSRPEFRKALGANWIHHYCVGKVGRFRFFSGNPLIERRANNLHLWRTSIEYCIRNSASTPSYPYMHDLYTELAESFYYDNKYPPAITNAQRAIAANKKYSKAYIVLANSLHKSGLTTDAINTVNDAIKILPNSKPLQQLRAELSNHLQNSPKPPSKDATPSNNITLPH